MSGHFPGEHTAQPTPGTLNHVGAVNGNAADPILRLANLQQSAALGKIEEPLPFALSGIDLDNGTEFINQQLLISARQSQNVTAQFTALVHTRR